jgi:alpha-tubulin suppressor-like RCC1 family protein
VLGQLGDGTTSTAKTPEQIVPSGVTAISAGQIHSLFLKNDGSLWAMGDNQYGELGDGTTTHALTPEQIVPSGVIAIAAGEFFSLFLKSDGSVWFMGYGYGVGIPVQINSSPVLYGAAYPPSLAITTVGGQPAVIYPLAGTNYVLQMTTNLASPNWVPAAGGTPAIAVIYTNTTPGAAFFRLR